MYIGLHVKYPLFVSDLNGNWIFSIDFWKILKTDINVHRPSRKVPVICIRFKWKLNFLNRFLKNTQNWHKWNSVQWEPDCSIWAERRTDRQADMTNLIDTFNNFANDLKTNKTPLFPVFSYQIHNTAAGWWNSEIYNGPVVQFPVNKATRVIKCGK